MRASHSVSGFQTTSPSILSRLRSTIGSAWQAYCKWYQYRAAQHHLAGMDDRMLQDIGISRSQIEVAISRGRSWKS